MSRSGHDAAPLYWDNFVAIHQLDIIGKVDLLSQSVGVMSLDQVPTEASCEQLGGDKLTLARLTHWSRSCGEVVATSSSSWPRNASTSKHVSCLVLISRNVSLGEKMARWSTSAETSVRSDSADWIKDCCNSIKTDRHQ